MAINAFILGKSIPHGLTMHLILQVKFAKSGSIVVVRLQVEKPICVELFENVPQLGRFTLRDEGRTIAIGKIIKLPKSLKEGAPEAK